MRREPGEPARPYGGRDYELMRAGRGGVYWRAAEGVEVRLAAAERAQEGERLPALMRRFPFARVLRGVLEF